MYDREQRTVSSEQRTKMLLLVAILLCLACPLFAEAAQETAVTSVAHNSEWTLHLTSLDVSSLPSSRQILGGVILQTLVESLKDIEYRDRTEEEVVYYRDLVWYKSRSDAAKALAAKQNERDLLVFRGEPSWRYQRTLQTVETDISRLEAALRTAETSAPLISQNPKIKITNPQGPWTAPPLEGDEYRFCTNQRADAFLSGRVTEYYDRIYITLKLYTIYSNSYSWEDSILFSSEDLDSALSELGGRFNAAISGLEPAKIIVHAEPEDTMIIIDDFWAGRGDVPLREHVPGTIDLAFHADNYVSSYFPLEINAGEITELSINLTPLGLSSFNIDVPDNPGSSVYSGGLFMGRTPLSIEFGADQLSHISVETPFGETGSAIFGRNANVTGNAEFIRSENTFSFTTALPVSPEEKRVAAARDSFYSAWGRFWIALPLSVVTIGFADNYTNAYKNNPSPQIYDAAQISSYVTIGAFVVIGLAVADTIYHIVRYLSASGADANPVARTVPEIMEYSDMEFEE